MGIECCLLAVEPQSIDELTKDPQEGFRQLCSRRPPSCDLFKEWHKIHFLLSGTADEGDEPEGYLLHGGEYLGEMDEDEMDEPPRLLPPEKVRVFNEVVRSLDDREMRRRFNLNAMLEADVYSVSEYPDDELEILSDGLKKLRQFLATAVDSGNGVVISYR